MSNHRTSISDLKLQSSGNLKRALSYGSGKQLMKHNDLLAMYDELMERRKDLLREIKRDGYLIDVEKSNSRGMIYMTKLSHPSIKVLQATERTLIAIARLLTGDDDSAKATALDDELDAIRKELAC